MEVGRKMKTEDRERKIEDGRQKTKGKLKLCELRGLKKKSNRKERGENLCEVCGKKSERVTM